MLRRVWASAAGPSARAPSPSGPRCGSSPAIARTSSSDAGAPSKFRMPAMPHMGLYVRRIIDGGIRAAGGDALVARWTQTCLPAMDGPARAGRAVGAMVEGTLIIRRLTAVGVAIESALLGLFTFVFAIL